MAPQARTWKKALALSLAFALSLPLFGGCQRQPEKHDKQVFAMDTIMTFTMYGDGLTKSAEQVLGSLEYFVQYFENDWSATKPEGDLFKVNAAAGVKTEVSPSTASLLREALELCEVTGGNLDITAYPAVEAWGFISGDYRVPSEEELEELVGRIDYTQVSVEREEQEGTFQYFVTLPAGMKVELGAVAKGAAADDLVGILAANDVHTALLDLGQSTIMAVGTKPDGSPWRIAVQDPAGEGYLGVLELSDLAVGTSGGYQRYFEQDGKTYWHIIDPDTAAPARSGLASVTVVGTSGLVCDGLSTALFVMGLEEGAQFWREHPELEVELLLVTDDGKLYVTPGMEEMFSLAQGYEDREVQVLS